MKEIQGNERTLIDLLSNKKYTIPYYQREYQWENKQVVELINDLTDEFLESYDPKRGRGFIDKYDCYYLGSVILNGKDIIDGQQRLTTITLLLIYLSKEQSHFSEDEQSEIKNLIFSKKYGNFSFNLDVEERAKCLEALYKDGFYNADVENPSIKNICDRYRDIEDNFPEDLKNSEAILYFTDWLINKVYLIEINTQSEQDAYKVFVTMNDRGLSLTPADMLKGYLLSQIQDDSKRNEANNIWKKQLTKLNKDSVSLEEKDFIGGFLRDWLRAQYADSIKENKKGAIPKDFDLIGTGFHKWIKDKSKFLNLNTSDDFYNFIAENFKSFSEIYMSLNKHAHKFEKDYAYIYYNSNRSITSLQYQLIMAALDVNDTEEVKKRKIQIVSCFLDNYLVRRVVNFKSVGYSTIKYAIFQLTKKIRRKNIDELKAILTDELLSMDEENLSLDNFKDFSLNNFFKWHVQHILARITNYIEIQSEVPEASFVKYIDSNSKNKYDIEHIIPNDFLANKDNFVDEQDFNLQRNMIGNLILLPSDKNRSYQDIPFVEKVHKYFGENLLAKTLNNECYQNNPRFLKFNAEKQLGFKAYNDFNKTSILERQLLYLNLVKNIWDVNNLEEI